MEEAEATLGCSFRLPLSAAASPGQNKPESTVAEVLAISGGRFRPRPALPAVAGRAWMLAFSLLLSAMSFSITCLRPLS